VVLAGLAQADTITVGPGGPGGGYDYANIQDGIDAAISGVDTVVVAQGVYYENINFGGKNIILTSIDPIDPNIVATTIIDAGGSGTVVTFSGSESTSCVLTGFTITGGYVTSSSYGGGITGNGSNATVSNCIIKNNTSDVDGGGLHNCDGDIIDCSISDNLTNRNGGGLYDCDGSISNCRIMNNVADGQQAPYVCKGGGLYGCGGIIANCVISGNTAGVSSHGGGRMDFGGGLSSCHGRIANCIIADNKVYGYRIGGGLHNCGGDITNNVITGNVGTYAGLYSCGGSISNCIIWGNSGMEMAYCSEPNYSCVEGGSSGTGNISDDPCFVDADSNDYHLLSDSPCIDTGDPGYVPIAGETDIDGEPRVMGGRVDMGADEFTSTLVPTIGISPTEFEFYATWGAANPETQILTIRNIGAVTLNWEIIEDCLWLEVDPNNGQSSGEANEVTISVDISGLDCGMYNCNLTISDPCAFNSPQIVPVNLNIAGPIIGFSPPQLEFIGVERGANPADQVLTIYNTGGNTLNWQISEDCNWLSVDPNNGSSTGEVDDVNVILDISALGGGIYNCELLVSDPNAENNPQTVAVTLHLGDADGKLYVPSEYTTIQEAIDVTWEGDTVIVAEGTYTGIGNKNLDYDGKAITVRSLNPNDPCVVAATIIDCENSGRGFYFHSGEDGNSIVTGLTVSNGNITGTPGSPDAYGGGIYCSGASPTIINCFVINNSVYAWNCSHCSGGTVEAFGGGISCVSNSHPIIINCTVSGNLAKVPNLIEGYGDAYGGGIFCSSDSTVAVYNCTITSNTSHGGMWMSDASWIHYAQDSYGGGIYISSGASSSIKNTLFADNETKLVSGEDYDGVNYGKSRGAGIFCGADVNVIIDNCTFYGNYTDPTGVRGNGGGIFGPATVSNCIIWNNLSSSQIAGSANVTYSDIEGGFSGTGNINADPCFVSGPLGDYYLSQTAAGQGSDSPCVDAGSNTAANLGMDIYTTRTDKVWDEGIVDMGYHYAGNVADLDNDGDVDLFDFAILASQWQDVPGLPSADIAPDGGDGVVDEKDLGIFCDNWLCGK